MSDIDADKAVYLIEEILEDGRGDRNLTYVEEIVIRQCWQQQSYQKIADEFGYNCDYIKQTGAKLWRLLSNALQTKVNKRNIHSVLRKYYQQKL